LLQIRLLEPPQGNDLIERHGVEVPAVDADIAGSPFCGELPVTVPVKVPSATVASVPNSHCIVKKDDGYVADLDLRVGGDGRPRQLQNVAAIVIPGDQVPPAATEAVEQVRRTIWAASIGKVAEVPDLVMVPHNLVPTGDQRLVHRVDVGKRTLAEAYDVRMSEMVIRSEPYFHGAIAQGAGPVDQPMISKFSKFEISEVRNSKIGGWSAFFLIPRLMRKFLRSARHRVMIDALIEYRRRAGMTQLELAQRIDRYPSLISNLEAGGRRIDLVELVELAEVLRFDIHELVDLVVATGKSIDGLGEPAMPEPTTTFRKRSLR
jgi:DNA-binding XRE family transcriptional regulator